MKKSTIAVLMIFVCVLSYYIEYGWFAVPFTVGLFVAGIVYFFIGLWEKMEEDDQELEGEDV